MFINECILVNFCDQFQVNVEKNHANKAFATKISSQLFNSIRNIKIKFLIAKII